MNDGRRWMYGEPLQRLTVQKSDQILMGAKKGALDERDLDKSKNGTNGDYPDLCRFLLADKDSNPE